MDPARVQDGLCELLLPGQPPALGATGRLGEEALEVADGQEVKEVVAAEGGQVVHTPGMDRDRAALRPHWRAKRIALAMAWDINNVLEPPARRGRLAGEDTSLAAATSTPCGTGVSGMTCNGPAAYVPYDQMWIKHTCWLAMRLQSA